LKKKLKWLARIDKAEMEGITRMGCFLACFAA
jgi:hypothetical protein